MMMLMLCVVRCALAVLWLCFGCALAARRVAVAVVVVVVVVVDSISISSM